MPKRKALPDDFAFGAAPKARPSAPKVKTARVQRAAQQSTLQRFVDEETRRAVQLARLDALEADNYGEDERPPFNLEAGGLYTDDVGASAVASTGKRRKKGGGGGGGSGVGGTAALATQRRLLNVRGSLRHVDDIAAGEAGASVDDLGRLQRDRAAGGRPVFTEAATRGARADPPFSTRAGGGDVTGVEALTGNVDKWAVPSQHYLAAATRPSRLPPVPFCGVCGERGKYSCTVCGARVCSKACNGTHRETRCMK